MIHILGLPHIQVSEEYCMDAFGMKILHFAQMFPDSILYASEDNDSKAELVTCITKKEQSKLGFNGPEDYLKNDFDNTKPLWQIFHQRAIYEMKKRVKKGDIICTFSGRSDAPIAEAFPEAYFIEAGVGYEGVYANFRVFESYAWMHTIYGWQQGASKADGKFYDVCIPNYFNPDDFPVMKKKDYFLFVGRMIHRKGIKIIEEMAKRMPDTEFIFAGQGATQEGNKIICQELTMVGDNLKYIGVVNIKERGKLMAEAKALICPTLYIGPMEGVHAEAMFCGTPVISTDFGVFTETNIEGVTGFRCHTIKQFVEATAKVDKLDPKKIREYAMSRFSMDVVKKMYVKYFEQIKGLERGGFYEQ